MKLKWNNPVITVLSIDKTEFGGKVTTNIDDTVKIGIHTYYSFS